MVTRFERKLLPFISAIILCISPAHAQQAAQHDFTIATYNINYANVDLKTLVDTILKADADVVALQEANKASEQYLRKALGKTYPHMEFHTEREFAGGFGILSKTPLEKPTYSEPDIANGSVFGQQTARVMLGDRELLIVNVHLMPTVLNNVKNMKEAVDLFAKTDVIRQKEIRKIIAALPKRSPAIVLGDYNSMPMLSKVPGIMKESGFSDSVGSVVENADGVPTWHWTLGATEYRQRLDYIFAARTNAKPVSGRVIESTASDHYLVACSYQWIPVPVELGTVKAQAGNVAYIADTTGMTPERIQSARELVNTSIATLKPEQNMCVGVIGGKETPASTTLAPANDDNKAAAVKDWPAKPAAPGMLAPALRKVLTLLSNEADPKAVFIVSDNLGKDPQLLKAVRALNTDKRLQFYVVDGDGKQIPN